MNEHERLGAEVKGILSAMNTCLKIGVMEQEEYLKKIGEEVIISHNRIFQEEDK